MILRNIMEEREKERHLEKQETNSFYIQKRDVLKGGRYTGEKTNARSE
jgi:hypothetical protein